MTLKRVTIQDIADACGLSRNTVSKIFNNRGAVPEATRKTVIQTAQELGYYQLPEETGYAPEISQNKNIALLTQHKLLSHNFGAFFITSFTDLVCRAGYTLKIFEISPQEIEDKKLPPHLSLKETAGFLCIELFSKPYQEMLCSLGIPCAFVDGYARTSKALMECDFISMENYAATLCLVERLIAAGAKRIGFVGDKEHCNSFYERWTAYSAALADAELTLDRSLCILEEDSENYGDVDWLLSRLTAMPTVPGGVESITQCSQQLPQMMAAGKCRWPAQDTRRAFCIIVERLPSHGNMCRSRSLGSSNKPGRGTSERHS